MVDGLVIRDLRQGDAPVIAEAFAAVGRTMPEHLYDGYLREQEVGLRTVLVAEAERCFAGYATILWRSPYLPFRKQGIPEITDLNVLPHLRKRGIASSLLDHAETLCAVASRHIGIGVGLGADYGAAQRLYVSRGYLPDGRGVTYDGHPIASGAQVPLDDRLVLQLIKTLPG